MAEEESSFRALGKEKATKDYISYRVMLHRRTKCNTHLALVAGELKGLQIKSHYRQVQATLCAAQKGFKILILQSYWFVHAMFF